MTVLGEMLIEEGFKLGETLCATLVHKMLLDGRLDELAQLSDDHAILNHYYMEYGLISDNSDI